MSLEDWLENPSSRRLLMAVGISIMLHISVAVAFEVSSSPDRPAAPEDPVQIERLVAEGSTAPPGMGNASFNSPARPKIEGAEQFNSLDAGVPVRRQNVPVPPSSGSASRQGGSRPPVMTQQPRGENLNDFNFPVYPQSQPRNNGVGRNNGQSQNQGRGDGNQQKPPRPTDAQNDGETPPASQPSQPAKTGGPDLPRRTGPNRNAFPIHVEQPDVKDYQIGGPVTNAVDVEVEVKADGSHSERIIRGSGSAEVDRLVLEAMKKWKWDPAHREGNPIDSVQSFKYKFNAKSG